MTILKAIILGLIQGITEFLPISSSGHLMIAENILGLSNDLIFSLILHLATLLAVALYYWRDILYIIKNPKSKISKTLYSSFAPTVLLALIVRKLLSEYAFINVLGLMFLITAILLLIPAFIKKRAKLGLGVKSGFIIGTMQGLACVPGISRSGTTIVTGQLCGLSEEESVKFSFILSIPIILGGIIYELIFSSKIIISTIFGLPMIIGFIVAFLSGLLSIKMVAKLTQKNKFFVFSIYLFIIGLLIIINSFLGII